MEVEAIARREQRIYRNSAAVFTLSNRLRLSMIDQFGVPAARVHAVYAGPNLDLARVPEEKAQRPVDSPPTVLFVGLQFHRKGGDLLVGEPAAVADRMRVLGLADPAAYADRLRARFLDRTGAAQEIEAEGLLARCLQHEIDHLNGVLFVDHLSALKRTLILRRLAKARRSKSRASA